MQKKSIAGRKLLSYSPWLKRLLIMKMIAILLLVVGLTTSYAESDAQTAKVNLKFNTGTVKDVIEEIEHQTNLSFMYDNDVFKVDRQISIEAENETLKSVVDKLISGENLKYEMVNRYIVITSAKEPTANQQGKKVTGKVTDSSGASLPGVSVVVKGTTIGVITDNSGNYALSNIPENATLQFSFVGMKIQEIKIGAQTSINVVLAEEAIGLDEVVAVGYGKQSRRNVTGSVTKVDMKRLETLPNTNITQSMRGTVAGLQVTENGRPGQPGNITVRGQRSISAGNNPLIVVDGIIFNGSINDVNSEDVESIEVLKDASAAAIYGSRAANGVILVTTKVGKTEKPTIRVNSYSGISDWSYKMKMLTPERYIQKILDYRTQSGQVSDPANIATYLGTIEAENYKNGKTINGWDAVSQQASIQNYDISLSGHTGPTTYYFSGAFTNEKGLIYNDNSKRIALRANVENEINGWLKIGMNSQFSKRDLSGQEADMNAAYWLSPYGSIYINDDKTNLIAQPSNDGLTWNPMAGALQNKNEDQNFNLFANFYALVNIPGIKGLTYRLNYSPNYRWNHTFNSSPIYTQNGFSNLGSASKNVGAAFDWTIENIVNYSHVIAKDHEIDATLMYGTNHYGSENTSASGSPLFNDALGWNNLGIAGVQTINSSATEQNGISSMFRLNYRFKNRYLLTLTARRDGASVFGANNKYATFPSAALAWIASDESFIKQFSFIDNLKFRLSYGSVGNQAISPYQSLDRSGSLQYVFGDGGTTSAGIYPSGLPNPGLTWETTKTTNLAIDFGFLQNRINGTVELYNMDTENLLLNRTIPTVTGFSSMLTNVGATNNKGAELTLNTVNLNSGKFEWSSNFVFSRNINKIVHLYKSDVNKDGVEDNDIGNKWFIGQPISVNYDYKFDGIFQQGDVMPSGYKPGYVKMVDVNGDGAYKPGDDRMVLSQQQPKYRWGFTNTIKYAGFTFSIFLNAMKGWETNLPLLSTTGAATNFPDRAVNMLDAGWWTAENKSATRPSLVYNSGALNHGYYVSRDFVRIQDVTLSYEFKKSLLEKLKVQGMRVYVSGKNLYTLTDYPGMDPESGYSGLSQYPTARTVVAGLSFSF